ncbi:hypothetical protein D8674_034558 [Pyrus ussuriensis x Pyrus communis]|uniref:Uncharacterized protein n=1 Tax=Pyrus ussuriensis x Pyrus communis TaxID=2448454 RepID=A0A5N5GFH7_9ROSA|nr:hypothetical protein D8674_034558 [Pyrus ussuriensis x Pyrus communis]
MAEEELPPKKRPRRSRSQPWEDPAATDVEPEVEPVFEFYLEPAIRKSDILKFLKTYQYAGNNGWWDDVAHATNNADTYLQYILQFLNMGEKVEFEGDAIMFVDEYLKPHKLKKHKEEFVKTFNCKSTIWFKT